jgi:hypothetical protein
MDMDFNASLLREQEDCGISGPIAEQPQHFDANKTKLEKNISRRNVGTQTEPVVESKRKLTERQILYTEPVEIVKKRGKANTSRDRLRLRIAANRECMKRAKGGIKGHNKYLMDQQFPHRQCDGRN